MSCKQNKIFEILFVVLIFSLFTVSSYSSSTVKFSQYGISTLDTEVSCNNEGNDFIMQIEPLSCTPSVIRSDLLEESNVPVFCKIAVTKINPFVEVDYINSISISGELSPYVSGVAYYPSGTSLGTGSALTSSLLENVGYVVINLKKQPNSSAIPDVISGNLTATLNYDIDEALGLGDATFYIPGLSESEWEYKKSLYSFWGNRGYLKIDEIDEDSATLSLYSDDSQFSTVTLKEGRTSNNIYVPDMDCNAGLKLKLVDLENPITRARLRINSEIIEVGKGEKFLENKCTVTGLVKRGLVQQVSISCKEDEGKTSFDLSISPKISFSVNGEYFEAEIGDYLNYSDGENGVYLGYIGTKGDSNKAEDLFVYLVSMPPTTDGKISDSELSSINFVVGDLIEAGQTSSGFIDPVSNFLKGVAGASNRLSRLIGKKQKLYRVDFGEEESAFGKEISITGYTGAVDGELNSKYENYYENAKTIYEDIVNSYSSESFSESFSYGEKALASEITLAYEANQKNLALTLCQIFETNYPNSYILPNECNDLFQFSNVDSSVKSVIINNQVENIYLDGIYVPSFEDYGVVVAVTGSSGYSKEYNLVKDKVIYLDSERGDYLKLISINDNSAKIKVSISSAGVMDSIKKAFNSDTITLEKGATDNFADYSISLDKINLNKYAKIYLSSNINDESSKANFSFNIGVEKRAINLSTTQIESLISTTNETVQTWKSISEGLDSVVTTLKTTCLATGAVLITKNFLTNLGGEGIARQYVMRGTNGWFDKCSLLVEDGEYSSVDYCLSEHSEEINQEVSSLTKLVQEQGLQIQELEKTSMKSAGGLLNNSIVDTNVFMEKYSVQVNDNLLDILPDEITDPSGKGKTLTKQNVLDAISYDGWNKNYFSTEELKNIQLYANVLDDPSASENLKEIANAEIYSELLDIFSNAEEDLRIQSLADNTGVETSKINSIEIGQNTRKLVYNGLTNADLKNKKISVFSDDTPVAILQTYPVGGQYILILENMGGTSKYVIKNLENQLQIYDYTSLQITQPSGDFAKMYFEKYDSSSYENAYKNPELSYYETEPYAGLPAVVPFDLEKGWYAATKQILPTSGNIQAYDASGDINSFYLCNVGTNGIEEFSSSGYGDDICILINTGTGQPFNQVSELSESDAEKFVQCGIDAIKQAEKLYPATGKVSIRTSCGGNVKFNVGEPAVDVPEFACQDFMSPEDCLLLSNLCDPVICPSSRCDFGGSYPVSDVVNSGIIGGILLCSKNAEEGIVIPFCLTAIKNGVDYFLSVQKSLVDCLQNSLDTGSNVGICDEISSVYLCDLFWEESSLFINLLGSGIEEGIRGGGEYLNLVGAMKETENAISYFSNYYGSTVAANFKSRSFDAIPNEICKSFISGTVPSISDLLVTLTESESPSQYYGNFEEETLTTVTSPALSHYKVYYHIYAGENSGAYYQVYLSGSAASSYYQDISSNVLVDSGYINAGDYISETKDFTSTSGYQKLCINVNGQEECGFKSVTTDFALNYAKDEYLSSQASATEISSQMDCVSGTTSSYDLLNLNIQSSIESLIDPEIYNQGLIRVCHTSNPGKTSDPNYGTENARWIDVGYCDDENMRCWLDTESMKNVIQSVSLEEETLNGLTNATIDLLQKEGNYITDSNFTSLINEIESETNYTKKIDLIESIFDKTFWSYQKANLLWLKGDAYHSLFKMILATIVEETLEMESEEEVENTTKTVISSGLTYSDIIKNINLDSLTSTQNSVLTATKELIGTSSSRSIYDNCWDAAYQSYRNANVGDTCAYSDKAGTSYTIKNEKCTSEKCNSATVTTTTYMEGKTFPTFAVYSSCAYSEDKLSDLKTGDLISYVWRDDAGHNAVFIDWKDKENNIAYLFDWNGGTTSNRLFRYYEEDLSDDAHPVYVYWRPISNYHDSSMQDTITNVPEETQEELLETESSDSTTNSETSSTKSALGIYNYAKSMIGKEVYLYNLIKDALVSAGFTEMESVTVGTFSERAGQKGQIYSADYLGDLISALESSSDFIQINEGELKPGDIILTGKHCTLPYGVYIYSRSEGNKHYFYTTSYGKVKEDYLEYLFTSDYSEYIYRAYRYKENILSENRELWTIDSAWTKSSELTGTYKDNKNIIDEFIFDDLFTQEECSQIRPLHLIWDFGNGADITKIRKILLPKMLDE